MVTHSEDLVCLGQAHQDNLSLLIQGLSPLVKSLHLCQSGSPYKEASSLYSVVHRHSGWRRDDTGHDQRGWGASCHPISHHHTLFTFASFSDTQELPILSTPCDLLESAAALAIIRLLREARLVLFARK